MSARNVAAVDLGAESGRVMLARYDGAGVTLHEMHRFPNRPARIRGHLFWDAPYLWNEILAGLRKAHATAGRLDSVGVDTWGVDYGLVDARGLLMGLPYHYRDHRTDGAAEQVFARVDRDEIYACTGIQFLPFNTLYQLAVHPRDQLAAAHRLLLIPDLVHSWLCGELLSERTNATTTQLWDVHAGQWSEWLVNAAGIPPHILPQVVEPGTVIGSLLPELATELGDGVRVAVPATHDTGSAIAAVPVTATDDWAYISSGTWSLVGLELPAPAISPEGRDANFTNEGGVFGTTRFLTNVMGLWLLQSCQRAWAAQGQQMDYEALLRLADDAPQFGAIIDPDDASFLAPENMVVAIHTWLRQHGQSLVESPGAMVRCVLESLVLRYREALFTAARLAHRQLRVVHVVGGGARNHRLNQWLADATGLTVVAGPAEATALGNALMQLVALGDLDTLLDVRRTSCLAAQPVTFQPHAEASGAWDSAFERFTLLKREGRAASR